MNVYLKVKFVINVGIDTSENFETIEDSEETILKIQKTTLFEILLTNTNPFLSIQKIVLNRKLANFENATYNLQRV